MHLLVAATIVWEIVQRTATGSMPWDVTVSPTDDAYVTHVGHKNRDVLRRYDGASLDVIGKASFSGHAVEAVLSADGTQLYVTNSRRHELVVLDAATLAVQARHPTGKIPKDLRLAPDGTRVYIADYGSHTISAIDLASGERTSVRVGKRPRGVVVTPDGATVYALNMGAGTVSVIDTRSMAVTATWTACKGVRHGQVVGDELLVSCLGANAVIALDRTTGSRTARIPVGKGPKTLAVSPDGTRAATADERSDTVTLIDLATRETTTVRLGADQPCGLAFSRDGSKLYVTARGSDELVVVRLAR